MAKPVDINPFIHEIRGMRVMLDGDLARFYEIETKVLNQAVKRNIDRFPLDFMFQLNDAEYENLKSQIVTSSYNAPSNLKSQFATSSWGGRRKLPFAFTEHGVAMLSSVIGSATAIQMNIAIIRAFVGMRHYLASPLDKKISDLEKILMLHIDDTSHNFSEHAETINQIIEKLNNLIEHPRPKHKIGFEIANK